MIVAFFLMILLPLQRLTQYLMDCIGLRDVNIQIDEDLATYFWAVEKEDRNEIVAEEINMRELYGVHMMTDSALKNY